MILPGDEVIVTSTIEAEKFVFQSGERMKVLSVHKGVHAGEEDYFLLLGGMGANLYNPNSKEDVKVGTTWNTIRESVTLEEKEFDGSDFEKHIFALSVRSKMTFLLLLLGFINGVTSMANAISDGNTVEAVLMLLFTLVFTLLSYPYFKTIVQSGEVLKGLNKVRNRTDSEALYLLIDELFPRCIEADKGQMYYLIVFTLMQCCRILCK